MVMKKKRKEISRLISLGLIWITGKKIKEMSIYELFMIK